VASNDSVTLFAAGASSTLRLIGYLALAIVLTRRMGSTDRPVTTLFYSSLVGFVLSGGALPFVWQAPAVADWAMLAAMGVLSAAGQYLFIAGLTRGPASLLAPFSYSQMIWSTLMGYLVFSSVPVAWTWVGAGLIIASGLYVAHRERVRARQR